MKSNRTSLFLILLFAAINSWACFAPPDAKPSNDISQVRLPDKSSEPAVVYTLNRYAFYLKPQDLLAVLQQQHYSITKPYDLLNSLQSKLPLSADLSTNALVAGFAPSAPDTKSDSSRSDAYFEDRRFWGKVESRLGYIIAELLDLGKAAVVDLSSGEALHMLTRDEYNDVCSGGRRFTAQDGGLILQTMDWIS